MNLEQQLYKLNQIGIALSSECDVKVLMEKILSEARLFTCAEGASLYIKKGDSLIFMVSYNEILAKGKPECDFTGKPLPLTRSSMAGYVGLTGEVLNIENAYEIPTEKPYRFQRSFDSENNYRTRSMLLVPMKDFRGEVIGVLALINARSKQGEIVAFDSRYEPLVLSLASQAAVAYGNTLLTQQLKDAYLETVLRLAMAAECREPDISGHLKRMSAYSEILAGEMGLLPQEVENIRYASPMHDIGKIGIPDAILLKPGKLTDKEYEIMKNHSAYGAKILSGSSSKILQLSEQVALAHHEYYNGSGYPLGLKGENIPLAGRIVALADVFDALASKRAYKDAWKMDEVTEYIRGKSGSQFDPAVVKVYERCVGEFIEVNRRYHVSKSQSEAAPLW